MKIIAHRGFSSRYPENTLLAFEKAIEAGADMIETDVRLSSDNVPVLFHDSKLKRISKDDSKVESSSIDILKKLDAGSWLNEKYKDQRIATLDELLELASTKIGLILEIKFLSSNFKKVCEEVNKRILDKLEWIEVSCFEDKVLIQMRALNPDIRLHKLIDKKSVLEQKDFDKKYSFVEFFDIDVTLREHPKVIELIKNKKVIFWTVDAQDLHKHIDLGLYGAMSNDPTSL